MTTIPVSTAETQQLTRPAGIPEHQLPAADLRAAVLQLARVIPARSSNPILTRAVLRSADELLTLSGTDLSTNWSETVSVPGLPPFEVAVDARRLAQFVGLLGKKGMVPFGVDMEARRLEVYAEDAGTLLRAEVHVATDHPMSGPLYGPMFQPDLVLPAGELATALRAVLYASGKDSFQAVFRGVCFHQRDGESEVAASNGYQVAAYRLSAPVPYMIIPHQDVRRLLTRFQGLPADLEVRAEVLAWQPHPEDQPDMVMPASQVRFVFGDSDVTITCVTGQFPDVDRVFLHGAQAFAEWSRKPLVARLRALQVMTDWNANRPVELTMTGSLMSLRSESDHGEAASTLDLTAPIGGARSVTARYNVDMLLAAVLNAPEDTLRIGIDYREPDDQSKRNIEIQSGNYRAVLVCLRS